MKLVIDVDEECYKNIKEQVDKMDYPDMQIGRSVAMGKPLPKGHGRLIDADTLVDGYEDNYEFCEALNATQTIIEADKESAE